MTITLPPAQPLPPMPQPPPPPVQGPWVPLWARRWPGPARPAAPATVVAVLGAAALGTLVLPLDRPGQGWLVAGVAALVALIIAARPVAPNGGPPPLVTEGAAGDGLRWGWATATIALLAVGTIRAAEWLFALCVLAALLTATIAAGRGKSVRALVYGATITPFAAARGLRWLAHGAAAMRRAGADGPKSRIAATTAIAAGLLVVFGALFASADAAFRELLGAVLPDLGAETVTRWVFLLPLMVAVISAAAYLWGAPPRTTDLDEPRYRPVRRAEWLVPLTALVLLFGAFVAVQATVLFGGARHVLTTAGLTYAEYARAGFWQLLVVTGLTLLVLAGAVRWAPRAGARDRTLVRVLLGLLAGLTLLIVASALYRMNTYADAYGLTRLRVLVFACELWLGAVFVLVLIAGIRLRAPWLPRAVVAAGVVALLGLAALDPDRMVAEHNLDRGTVDAAYLADLSADAVPALVGQPCLVARVAAHLREHPDEWYELNLARSRARDLLKDVPQTACPGVS